MELKSEDSIIELDNVPKIAKRSIFTAHIVRESPFDRTPNRYTHGLRSKTHLLYRLIHALGPEFNIYAALDSTVSSYGEIHYRW